MSQAAAGPSLSHAGSLPSLAMPRRSVAIALVLALVAAFGPLAVGLGFLADPGAIASRTLLAILAALLLLAPAAVAFAVALRGLPAVSRDLAARPDSEHEQILIRVGIGTAVLGYTVALLALYPGEEGLGEALVVASVGQSLAWFLLVHIVLRPAPAEWRRLAAMVLDVASLSGFLHYGGGPASCWYFVYLWITFGYGFRYSNRHLLLCGSMSLVGFGIVVATTPFWQSDLALAIGLMLALVSCPPTSPV